jgi:hypothetical protein
MIVRYHPKLRDVWPPEPGGAYQRGFRTPEGGKDILEQVFYYAPVAESKADIALRTRYEGHEFTRDLLLEDPVFAGQLSSWLRQHTGRSIQEIGDLELALH